MGDFNEFQARLEGNNPWFSLTFVKQLSHKEFNASKKINAHRNKALCALTLDAFYLYRTSGNHMPMAGKMYSNTIANTWIAMKGSMPAKI